MGPFSFFFFFITERKHYLGVAPSRWATEHHCERRQITGLEFWEYQQVPGKVFMCACSSRIIIWHTGGLYFLAGWVEKKDTSQYIIVERGEVFQRVHHRGDEVVIPLDLGENLNTHANAIIHFIPYTVAGLGDFFNSFTSSTVTPFLRNSVVAVNSFYIMWRKTHCPVSNTLFPVRNFLNRRFSDGCSTEQRSLHRVILLCCYPTCIFFYSLLETNTCMVHIRIECYRFAVRHAEEHKGFNLSHYFLVHIFFPSAEEQVAMISGGDRMPYYWYMTQGFHKHVTL